MLRGVKLIYADDALIVGNKPSGLLSVPGRGVHLADCMAARIEAIYPNAMIVHRLDMATSGLMVLTRGPQVQRHLSQAFAQREVHKHYVAVVHGCMAHDEGAIDLALIADWPNRPKQKCDAEHGKPSLTRYRVLERNPSESTTRVALQPVTGRSHQLRVHLLSLGHPILGDMLYAPEAVQAEAPRLLLHATELSFRHPVTQAVLCFESAAPF
jgi:tRNA pseudouridine32 synthase / 23S rRNA pseudouridine746 synthase